MQQGSVPRLRSRFSVFRGAPTAAPRARLPPTLLLQQQQRHQRLPPPPACRLPPAADYGALLRFACDGANPVLVEVADALPPSGRGRGLVVTRDAAAGEVLLSVPLSRVFESEPDEQLLKEYGGVTWSAEMAARLLGELAAGDASVWRPWLACLPRAEEGLLTPAAFDDAAAGAIGLKSAAADVAAMRASLRACYDELLLDSSSAPRSMAWPDFLWAVQAMHSRCFVALGKHLCVPGVDMANHSFAPNAAVRIAASPDAAQGLAALEDIAPLPPPGALAPPAFQLVVAADDGVVAGEEITINYGGHPTELFFLLFGFVPTPNLYDKLLLYADAAELVSHYRRVLRDAVGGVDGAVDDDGWVAAAEVALGEAGAAERLVATADGLDARLAGALKALRQSAGAAVTGKQVVQHRLRELLAELDAGERRASERRGGGGSGSSDGGAALALAAQFREAKRALLLRILEQV